MNNHHARSHLQQGGALIILMLLLVLAGTAALLTSLDSSDVKIERERKTAIALAEAKAALIGYAVTNTAVVSLGYLPNPDFGPGVNVEGSEGTIFVGNVTDFSLVGKLPWNRLGLSVQKDGANECLWYALSGRFKNSPKTAVLNWDTQGQIDVIDAAGNMVASNLAALVISPGQPLGVQGRQLADPALVHCGGNYDAKNYLDAYDLADAIAGQVNYFTGSVNNRLAANTANKQFVLATNDFYNDRLVYITVDEIFRAIIRRNDFAIQVGSFLDDPGLRLQVELGHPETKVVSGAATKGADNIVCNDLSNADNRSFCNHWKEMLLLTELPVPNSIAVDGVTTATCSRVMVFGGKRLAAQPRFTAADKNNPANYLEGTNFAAFASPVANNSNFNGVSVFSANNPSADVMRCL